MGQVYLHTNRPNHPNRHCGCGGGFSLYPRHPPPSPANTLATAAIHFLQNPLCTTPSLDKPSPKARLLQGLSPSPPALSAVNTSSCSSVCTRTSNTTITAITTTTTPPTHQPTPAPCLPMLIHPPSPKPTLLCSIPCSERSTFLPPNHLPLMIRKRHPPRHHNC